MLRHRLLCCTILLCSDTCCHFIMKLFCSHQGSGQCGGTLQIDAPPKKIKF